MTLDVKGFRASFFDRDAVMNATSRAERQVLSKFGAFVWKRAKTSIRQSKKKTSEPGKPPIGKTRKLRRFIFFAYDKEEKSVVIGPARLSGTVDPGAPARLEFGGSLVGNGRTIFVTNKVGRDKSGRFVSGGKTRIVLRGTVNYKKRPYMGPALKAERPKLPGLWRNTIK